MDLATVIPVITGVIAAWLVLHCMAAATKGGDQMLGEYERILGEARASQAASSAKKPIAVRLNAKPH